MNAHRKVVSLSLYASLALLASGGSAGASDKPRPAPPIKPAAQYALNDTHPTEKVTVAAEPCSETAACPFFRLPYVTHGFLPVRVIITNDRDQALVLDDVRIQFLPYEGDKIPAATDEDLNRRLFSTRSAAGTKLPVIPITIHHEPVDKKILNDDTDFGFQSTTVAPHSTAAGYVFYDTRGIDDPVLKHAELYMKMIHSSDAKGARQELFAFTLPFDRWLTAQPASASTSAAKKPSAEPVEPSNSKKKD